MQDRARFGTSIRDVAVNRGSTQCRCLSRVNSLFSRYCFTFFSNTEIGTRTRVIFPSLSSFVRSRSYGLQLGIGARVSCVFLDFVLVVEFASRKAIYAWCVKRYRRPRLFRPDFSREKRVLPCSIGFPLRYEAEAGYGDSPKYSNIYRGKLVSTLYQLYETVRCFAST